MHGTTQSTESKEKGGVSHYTHREHFAPMDLGVVQSTYGELRAGIVHVLAKRVTLQAEGRKTTVQLTTCSF
jgi:hypothetical protein